MTKRVILITGTPCVGKTSTAKTLTAKLDASYINLTELATKQNLTKGKDRKRNTTIINESRMQQELRKIIMNAEKEDIIIDGHYAATATPKDLVTHVFVLRRDPIELKKLMQKNGFSNSKLWENLAAEILDVCLVDALKAHGKEKVCELNVTGKSVEEVVDEILDVLRNHKKCRVGIVDWLDTLEKQGRLDEFLKI